MSVSMSVTNLTSSNQKLSYKVLDMRGCVLLILKLRPKLDGALFTFDSQTETVGENSTLRIMVLPSILAVV